MKDPKKPQRPLGQISQPTQPPRKALALHRETLRSLSSTELRAAAGGTSLIMCGPRPTRFGCTI